MSDQKFKLKKGDELIIELPSQIKLSGISKTARGILPSHQQKKTLSRRNKQASGIRFFDCGVKNNITISHSILPDVTGNVSTLNYTIDDLTTEQYQEVFNDIRDVVFAEPSEAWNSLFKLINKADAQAKGITIYYEQNEESISETLHGSAKMAGSVLKLNSEGIASLYLELNTNLFHQLGFYLHEMPENIKVTLLPNVEASPAEFIPSNVMDIFLMPSLQFAQGSIQYYSGIHAITGEDDEPVSDFIKNFDLLGVLYDVFPRDLFADFFDVSFEDIYLANYLAWQIIKQFPNCRGFYGIEDFFETPPYNYFRNYSEGAAGSFPYAIIYTPAGIVESIGYEDNGYSATLGMADDNSTNKLLMIIKKAGQIFYFWKLSD